MFSRNILIRVVGVLLVGISLLPMFSTTAQAQDGDTLEFRQWAIDASATSQYGDDSWSARQATGEPDSSLCVDQGTAWASATNTGQDSLTLVYAEPVVPTQVNIYQTYNPGAITGIELVLADGSGTLEVTNSADPGTECPGVLTVDILEETALVNGVIIHLDQTITGNWNEIDAVELVGVVQLGEEVALWANEASATSQYGDDAWSASQATGIPDSPNCADQGTAWASESATGQDALTVYFPFAVIPTQLDIYQTYNPGAITGVDLLLLDGSQVPVENSADPGTDCPGVFSLPLTEENPAIGAVIALDQTITGSWNEIDAVQIIGALYSQASEFVSQWAIDASATSQYGDDSWSARQATGEPNTIGCGDQGTAWASESATGLDSLTVVFEDAVIPTQVNIYQSYNPGAITGIELVLADGSGTLEVTNSADPGTECPGVLTVDILEETAPVNGVIIHLDQTITGDWNEIDAVELVGKPLDE